MIFYEIGNLMINLVLFIFNHCRFNSQKSKSQKPQDNILRKLKSKCFKKENTEEFSFKVSNESTNNDKNISFKSLNGKIFKKLNLRFVLPIFITIILLLFLILNLIFSMELALIFLIAIFLLIGFITQYPKMREDKINAQISNELPYALRQMVSELKSGKGLFDTLNSIAISNYYGLSPQISRTLEEIKYGETTENALLNLSKRINSAGLRRTLHQIVGTLKTGGNLSYILSIIAEDISNDLRIKLKEYSQKLNAFVMIYTFLAVLAPVILLVMIIASSTILGDVIPPQLVLVLYIFFFPLIIVFMGIFIKRLEPRA
jgi:flagellar protein FlaJ